MERFKSKVATRLVAAPIQSAELDVAGLIEPFYDVPDNYNVIARLSWLLPMDPDSPGDDYYCVELDHQLPGSKRSLWFLYAKHWQEYQTGANEQPTVTEHVSVTEAAKLSVRLDDPRDPVDSKELIKELGPTIIVPGLNRPVHLGEPVLPNGSFTWAEVTKNGQRVPVSQKVTDGVLEVAEAMQMFREAFDQPIIVTSWYRDPATNRRVGGASRSKHLEGLAVDWYPVNEGITLEGWKVVCQLQKDGGVAAGRGFFHTDKRKGPAAHWRYSGAPGWTSVRY